MSDKLHRFLATSGSILLLLGTIRMYRVIRMHAEDPVFAPHLLGASVSTWIAYSLLKIGLHKRELNRKGAISLIRSGSVLLAIWSYRFVLFLRNPVKTAPLLAYLAPFYIVFGTIVMCVGLKISRKLRRETRKETSLFSEEGIKEDPAPKIG